jgi:hypothetical protein
MSHQANYTLALLCCLRACADDIRRRLDRLDAYLAMTPGGSCSVDHPLATSAPANASHRRNDG